MTHSDNPQHCLSLDNFSRDAIFTLIEAAQKIISNQWHVNSHLTTLQGITMMPLFFENSTRTRVSFELAHERCQGSRLSIPLNQSSLEKGETLLDMFLTLQAMHINLFVIRHQDHNVMQLFADHANENVHIINAGSGTSAHPSQALLDLFTLVRHFSDCSNLSIAIIGDILHSRVAHSDINLFQRIGIRDIRLFGPAMLMPTQNDYSKYVVNSLKEALDGVDAIILLRNQLERMPADLRPDIQTYHQQFGLNKKKLSLAKQNAIIMHPGPIQRGIEIANDLADCSQSRILQQVENGVAMRMALLQFLTKRLSYV